MERRAFISYHFLICWGGPHVPLKPALLFLGTSSVIDFSITYFCIPFPYYWQELVPDVSGVRDLTALRDCIADGGACAMHGPSYPRRSRS